MRSTVADEILRLLRVIEARPECLPQTDEILTLLRRLHGRPEPAAEVEAPPFVLPAGPRRMPPPPRRPVPPMVPVRAFFAKAGWEGGSVAAPAAEAIGASPRRPFSGSVRAFLGSVSWDGTGAVTAAAVPTVVAAPVPATSDTGATEAIAVPTASLDVPVRSFLARVPWDPTPAASANHP